MEFFFIKVTRVKRILQVLFSVNIATRDIKSQFSRKHHTNAPFISDINTRLQGNVWSESVQQINH